MRRLHALCLLLLAQATATYPGQRVGTAATVAAANSCALLATTGALYGDSIAAGACSGNVAVQVASSAGPGWLFSSDAGDGEQPAIAGYTAPQIRARYTATRATACLGQECGYVVVEGGVNSLKGGATPEDTMADMVWVVDDALARGHAVVWLGVLPYAGCTAPTCQPDQVAGGHAKALAYNALVASACATRRAAGKRLRCLDVYEDFEDPQQSGHLKPEYACDSGDGIHLEAAGGTHLAQRVATEVLQVQACH